MKNFIRGLRRLKIGDLLHGFKFLLAIIPALFLKRSHPDLWLLCEDKNEARDNGYWFYRYIRMNHPKQDCVYAINSNSVDYPKVADLGKVVEYGTLRHWIYYLAANWNISSQKGGKPNAPIAYFLEVYGILKNKRCFLQHGVIKDDLTWLYYNVTKMSIFCCGAYPEYKYIKERYGYPKGAVQYLGLCRFDNLHDICTASDSKMILIMPTWREWIADEDYRLREYEGTTDIPQTNYFKMWNLFLNDNRIDEIAKTGGVKFLFYPHRNMQKYLEYFTTSNKSLTIADWREYDVQSLLKQCSMLITDYSSVFFDAAYMKKPILFYQFDYEIFRTAQYGEGYFDYKNNPFGKSVADCDSLFSYLEAIVRSDFSTSEAYQKAHREYFPNYDTNNCERTYNAIKDYSCPKYNQ